MTNPSRLLSEYAALLTIATRLRDDRAAAGTRAVQSGTLTVAMQLSVPRAPPP